MKSSTTSRRWWIVAVAFVGLYGALALCLRAVPANIVDREVIVWVDRGAVSFLDGTMDLFSWFTDLRPRLVLGAVGIAGIALTGRYRLAVAVLAAIAVTAVPINVVDLVGGIVVGRARPSGASFAAFPSGHTLGTIVQFGVGVYLVVRLVRHRRFLLVAVAVLAVPMVAVGPARILTRAHWPTDVLGAYLLGVASVIVVVLVIEFVEQWLADRVLLGDAEPGA
jgi:undecaprenyl-diphosphatase